jgi:branched-chain amino acid transport system substrate-binding protein
VLAPLSGKYAAYGKAYLDGAQLATDAFDDKRGPARVELVPADSRGEALPALAATRRLVATDGLVAILGSVLSLPTVVAGLQANCSRVPLLSNVATEEGIADIGPYVFHIGPSRLRAARSAADLVVFSLRRFRAAVLCSEDGDGRTLATAFGERLCGLGGEVVASESYAAGTTDFTAVARRLRASGPDVLYLPASVDETLLIAPALAVQGFSAPLVGTEEWSSDRLLRAAGADLEGALLPAPDADASGTEMARFRDAYRARYARPDNRYAAAGYVGATRLLDLLAQNPGADRETLRRELEESLRVARPNAGGTPRFLVVRDGEARPFEMP